MDNAVESQGISSSALQGAICQSQYRQSVRWHWYMPPKTEFKRFWIYGSRWVRTSQGVRREEYAHFNNSGLIDPDQWIGSDQHDANDEPIHAVEAPFSYPRGTLISPAIDSAEGNSKISIWALPPEVRLRIYHYLLVARPVDGQHRYGVSAYVFPAVLRTCRKIYNEASPVLYSQNVFSFSGPDEMLRFTARIGNANLEDLKSVQILLLRKTSSWRPLLHTLIGKAKRLHTIELICSRYMDDGCQDDFARSHFAHLANLQGLTKLKISGHLVEYAPEILKKLIGVPTKGLERLDIGDIRDQVWPSFWSNAKPTVGGLREGGLREGGLREEDFFMDWSCLFYHCSDKTLFWPKGYYHRGKRLLNTNFNPVDDKPNDLESAWIRRDGPSGCKCPIH